MKKVAIYLTGLIQDRTHVLPHVKRSFDYIAEALDLEIDYYCHFWDTTIRYTYIVDSSIELPVDVPLEDEKNISKCIDIFNPVDYTIASFNDYFPIFLKINGIDLDDYEPFRNSKHLSCYKNCNIFNLIKGAVIDREFFINAEYNEIENAGNLFNIWWDVHTLWSTFVLESSQGISTANCNKMITWSGQQYDACFKSRYDLLFNYSDTNFIKIFNELLKLVDKNQNSVILESIYLGDGISDTDIEHTTDIRDFVCTSDTWWAHDVTTSNKLAESFLENYCNSIVLRTSKWNSQHTYYYKAFRKSNLTVKCLKQDISSVIIRSNVEIPKDYHTNTTRHFLSLHEQFLNQKMSADSEQCYNQSNQTAKYHTARQFNFNVFKKK
jgi:hypothetical protein